MKRLARCLLVVAPLLFTNCARHFVVERDAGRVDGARSITTSSDEDWSVTSEPAPRDDED